MEMERQKSPNDRKQYDLRAHDNDYCYSQYLSTAFVNVVFFIILLSFSLSLSL